MNTASNDDILAAVKAFEKIMPLFSVIASMHPGLMKPAQSLERTAALKAGATDASILMGSVLGAYTAELGTEAGIQALEELLDLCVSTMTGSAELGEDLKKAGDEIGKGLAEVIKSRIKARH